MAYIQDGETVTTRLHKLYGPASNALSLQLHNRGINRAILAGIPADLCVEAPKGELLEQGIEVVVVKDTTPAAKLPEGDGYQTALVNFRFMQMPSIAQMKLLRPLARPAAGPPN